MKTSTKAGAPSSGPTAGVKVVAVTADEERFIAALADMFVGVRVEGVSGYINLMTIKTKYLNRILGILRKDIEEKTREFPEFRKELFEKLYAFFKRYFNPTGSLYFASTPFSEQVYERVYTDRDDVSLFWKTNMLYYVKTDRLFQSMKIEIGGLNFFFDLSKIEHKKAWEKKELVYELGKVEKDRITFNVSYSERGRKTNNDEILHALKKKHQGAISEAILNRAFTTFEKQSEVDYFINKNARAFLKEQFNLWFYQYVFSDTSQFSAKRLSQLRVLKEIAYSTISFIGQFEEELAKVWNKPKFAMHSNYVVTLDRIAQKHNGIDLIRKVVAHKNFGDQVEEWKQYSIVNAGFNRKQVVNKELNPKYKFLPIDTRYFKDLELEIISLLSPLDLSMDGWLIKSENYQALNTILPKFNERVQTIYIDPPFNKEQNADYFYDVKFKDSTWITMLENRLALAKQLLKASGSIFVRCDYNGNMLVRFLMNRVFRPENFGNEIIINRFRRQLGDLTRLNVATDSLFYYTKSNEPSFFTVMRKRMCSFCGKPMEPSWRGMSSPGLRHPPERRITGRLLLPPRGRHWTFTQEKIESMEKEGRIRTNEAESYVDLQGNKIVGLPEYLQTEETPADSIWTDLKGYVFGSDFPTENPEELLERVILTSTKEGDYVLDFFLGSGTTVAAAHKLGRKWIGVEMDTTFEMRALPRMKKVLWGESTGISKDVNWNGGGFFKYYELEQYENALARTRYGDSAPFLPSGEDPYNQYVFLKDPRLLEALEIDYKKNKVLVNLPRLYVDIDIAETLSNLTGKWIRRITKKFIEFADGTMVDVKDLDYKLVKPLIWW